MLQACLNGGRRPDEAPGIPLTPGALARDAAAAVAAGADCLHIHPRGADGAETLAPGPVAAALAAMRAACPGVPAGVGTGAWIAPGGTARHGDIRGWTVLPDYASVNLNEPDAPEVIALLAAMGVPVEAGLWTRADAERYLAEIDPAHCCRVLIEMPDDAPRPATGEADIILGQLARAGDDRPVLLHGLDRSAWACLAYAANLAIDTRVGFEDMLTLPDATPAPSNAALVRAAREIVAAGGA